MLADDRVRTVLGADARFVHFDCTVQGIATERPIGRAVRRLFSAPVSRMAFGNFFLTDAEGTTLYGVRPCSCRRQGPLRTGADLLHLESLRELAPDPELDLETLRAAMVRFQRHRELRKRVAAGGDPLELQQFEASLPDGVFASYPCRVVDRARISTLTIGYLQGSGGNPVGLARTLDPVGSPSPALRDMLAPALTEAALRDDPCHEAAGPHLGVTYLLVARDEIKSAVASACRKHGCTPAELPLHLLPIPLAARERLARMVCGARSIVMPEGSSALDVLRRALT